MITLSSHVLDLEAGRPGGGMRVMLARRRGDEIEQLFEAQTDADGRVTGWSVDDVADGLRVTFATGPWYAAQGRRCLYPEVAIDFDPPEPGHYHIPLLVNRNGYTTYRGS